MADLRTSSRVLPGGGALTLESAHPVTRAAVRPPDPAANPTAIEQLMLVQSWSPSKGWS